MSLAVLGGGRAAVALAGALAEAGVPVAGLWARRPEAAAAAAAAAGVRGAGGPLPNWLAEADTLLIAVSDGAIGSVAAATVAAGAAAGRIVLHTAGALPAAAALAPARGVAAALGTLHPFAALAGGRGALAGAWFGVEGDPAAADTARRLVAALGGHVLELTGEVLPLYHAAAALAANGLVAVVDAALAALAAAGVDPARATTALVSLLAGNLDNLAGRGLAAALTGPAARGDAATVARHLAALRAATPDAVPLYDVITRRLVRVARDGGLGAAAAAEVLRTLEAKP